MEGTNESKSSICFSQIFWRTQQRVLISAILFRYCTCDCCHGVFSLVEQRSQNPDSELSWTFYILLTITTLLYPYSRWVYETVLGFILGRNLFIAPLDTFFLLKLFTMAMCFALAIWIAPIGLIAIYIYNTMQENKNSKEG